MESKEILVSKTRWFEMWSLHQGMSIKALALKTN